MKRINHVRLNIPHTVCAINISSDSDQFTRALYKIYYPYISVSEVDEDIHAHISFEEGHIIVAKDRVRREFVLDKKNSISQVCRIVQELQKSVLPWNLYHGSAVCVEGKTIVFLGASGSGKTTLTAYLLKNCKNCIYISEDILLINCESNTICPYPRPLHLRRGGMEFLKKEYGFASEEVGEMIYGNYERYIINIDSTVDSFFYVDFYIT